MQAKAKGIINIGKLSVFLVLLYGSAYFLLWGTVVSGQEKLNDSSLIPVASFEKFVSNMEEGSASTVKVNFSTAFNGTFKYNISGTATTGNDYELLGGSIQANGEYVDIPIVTADDSELEKSETIVLSIYYKDGESPGYIPGASTDHTVYVSDNDAIWNGTIEINDASLHFQMKIIQEPSGAKGALISDGYGIIPLNSENEKGEWPAETISLSKTSFDAVIDHINIPENLTRANTDLRRKFMFQSNNVKPNEIRGTLTEYLTSSSEKQLNREMTGTFILLRQIPDIELREPLLEDVKK